MFSDQQIEALAHGCAGCAKTFSARHFITSCYVMRDIRSFETHLDVGIIGEGVRNLWFHIDCNEPDLKSWKMRPDIQTCIRCRKRLDKEDIVQPVFGVIDGNAVNPSDPTDRGVSLSDRIYFIHADCKNKQLKSSIFIP